jgi:hypothetical protein
MALLDAEYQPGLILSASRVKSTDAQQIKDQYERNCAFKLHQNMRSAENYLEEVMKKVPVNKLYEVKDFLFIDSKQAFMPVLLEIKHKDLLQQENSPNDSVDKISPSLRFFTSHKKMFKGLFPPNSELLDRNNQEGEAVAAACEDGAGAGVDS